MALEKVTRLSYALAGILPSTLFTYSFCSYGRRSSVQVCAIFVVVALSSAAWL